LLAVTIQGCSLGRTMPYILQVSAFVCLYVLAAMKSVVLFYFIINSVRPSWIVAMYLQTVHYPTSSSISVRSGRCSSPLMISVVG